MRYGLIGLVCFLSGCQVGASPGMFAQMGKMIDAAPRSELKSPVKLEKPVANTSPESVLTVPVGNDSNQNIVSSSGKTVDSEKSISDTVDNTDLQPSSQLPTFINTGSRSSGGSGGGGSSIAPVQNLPKFRIDRILLQQTQQSITENNPLDLDYFESNPVTIQLNGQFDSDTPFTEEDMRFTFANGLLHQTFTGNEPLARATINDLVILEPVSVNNNAIVLKVNGFALPDLQNGTSYELRLQVGTQKVSVPLYIEQTASTLFPEVSEHQWITSEGAIKWLQLKGKNFMLDPDKNEITLNNEILPHTITQIFVDGVAETWLKVDDQNIDPLLDYQLTFRTPFGIIVQTLSGEAS